MPITYPENRTYGSLPPYADREVVVAETPGLVGSVARVVALVAGGVLLTIGSLAAVEIDWDPDGFDAPAVEVARMTFTPEVAVATMVLGLIAVGAAALSGGDGAVVVGAIVLAMGVAVLLASDAGNELALSDRHGWFATLIGAALAISGLLMPGEVIEREP